MPLPLRVGLFPYLNAQPLIFGLHDDSDFEVVTDLPSRIADRFRRGEFDLAMVPSFEAATIDAPILDSVCIASNGPVETVILHHRVALDRVKTLALDHASRTSAVLARILLTQASGHGPECTSFSPTDTHPPDADAVLIIGDPAFTYARPGFARLDLGLAWRQRHSLPFVFALMVKGPRANQEGISGRIGRAMRRGRDAASTIARSYNCGVDAARAEHYMKDVIRYDLGPREKEGLRVFYRLAQENGLLPLMKERTFDAI